MATSSTTHLERATELYARRLRELIAALEGAQDLLFELAENHEQVVEVLETIGKTLSREPPTEGIERGLAILSGTLRALHAGTLQLDALGASQSSILHTLRGHGSVVDALSRGLSRSAQGPAPVAVGMAQAQS